MRWDLSSKTDGVSKDMSWISALSQGRLLLHYPFNFARNNRTKLQQLCSFFEFKQLSSCNNELCSPVLAVQLMYTKAERINFPTKFHSSTSNLHYSMVKYDSKQQDKISSG